VSVRDDGIGIPAEHLATVFDMFTQVDRSSRRTQGGLSIGLTLVRSLVEMHGGRVEARSDGPGLGSEFVVRLPVAAGVAPHAGAGDRSWTLKPRRILVVDDNRDAADMLATLLATLGATTHVAHSGDAALSVLESFRPDVVLLDIGMPDLDGYEVARRIRAHPEHCHALLIALTGWGQAQDQARSRAAGFDHHLIKPLDVDRLRELLESATTATPEA
jgi:CheY-like chemotaxis protein